MRPCISGRGIQQRIATRKKSARVPTPWLASGRAWPGNHRGGSPAIMATFHQLFPDLSGMFQSQHHSHRKTLILVLRIWFGNKDMKMETVVPRRPKESRKIPTKNLSSSANCSKISFLTWKLVDALYIYSNCAEKLLKNIQKTKSDPGITLFL